MLVDELAETNVDAAAAMHSRAWRAAFVLVAVGRNSVGGLGGVMTGVQIWRQDRRGIAAEKSAKRTVSIGVAASRL